MLGEEKDSKYSYEALYEYLCRGAYPVAVDEKYKHGLRKHSKIFICKEGQLFYTGGKSGANNIRLVIQQDKEKRRVISSIHEQAHLGRDKTATAVTSRYYWTNLYNDVSR